MTNQDQFNNSSYGKQIASLGLGAEKAAQQLLKLIAMYRQAQMTVEHFQKDCQIRELEEEISSLRRWVRFLGGSLIGTILLLAYDALF